MEQKLEELIIEEVVDSTKKYGEFNSTHEGYAVLLEELDELSVEYNSMIYWKERLWESIKTNDPEHVVEAIINLKILSIRLLQEGIQVAAMSNKFFQLMNHKVKND